MLRLLLVALLLLPHSSGVNYCQSKMCAYTNAHTFCQFAGGRSRECVGYINAPLTEDEKEQIINRMNQRRNEVASGKIRGWPSATNMMRLRWVSELAREAQLWADQCRKPKTPEEHDACRDLYSVSVGQCVATVIGDAPGLKVVSLVDMWFMQGLYYKKNVTVYVPPPATKHFYGDFAQLIWANSYMVGCGRSRFLHSIRGRLQMVERLVCNVAPSGPVPGRPLWSPGAPAAACPDMATPDADYSALCFYHYQNITNNKINNSTVLQERVLLNTVLEMEGNEQANIGFDEKYAENLAKAIVKAKNKAVSGRHKTNLWKNVEGNSDANEIDRLKDKILNRKMSAAKAKRLNLVGRPKTYKYEELSGNGGDLRTYNIQISEEHKKQSLFYIDDDYNTIDYDDTVDISKETAPESTTVIERKDDFFRDTTDITRVNLNLTFGENENPKVADKAVEDLNNPETASELQAALEHLEKDGESRGLYAHGKVVRRDLRDIVTVATLYEEQDKAMETDKLSYNKQEIDPSRSTTIKISNIDDPIPNISDKNPMMDMVMRYMPYLKKYERELTNECPSNYVGDFQVFICLVLLSIL